MQASRSTGGRRVGVRRLATPVLVIAALHASAAAQNEEPPRWVAIQVGTVHPVDGPAIENGVILIRDGKIRAVGPADKVGIPASAEVITHQGGHAYPGLVDAASTAFCPAEIAATRSTDAGSTIADGLDRFDPTSADLAATGITTAYVRASGETPWRGIGCLIRPQPGGFELFPDAPAAAVHVRMTTGPNPSHALVRQKELTGIERSFDGLDDYAKAAKDYADKLAEYKKKFDEYIGWHEKKKPQQPPAEGSAPAAGNEAPRGDARPAGGEGEGRPPGERRRRGARPAPGGEQPPSPGPAPPSNPPPSNPPSSNPAPAPGDGVTPAEPKPEGTAGAKPDAAAPKPAEDKAPEKPKFPPKPAADPIKDALLAVRDGERPLSIEARRADEVGAALALAASRGLRRVVLEDPVASGPLAGALAKSGASAVLTSVQEYGRTPYLDEPDDGLVRALAGAGVPVALGSGSVRRARALPLLAAQAVGLGLDPDLALRAITLTPAEILGVGDRVGSLSAGKLGDVLITSAPLFASDARVLRVVQGGRTIHEGQ